MLIYKLFFIACACMGLCTHVPILYELFRVHIHCKGFLLVFICLSTFICDFYVHSIMWPNMGIDIFPLEFLVLLL
jgi:hypothetical protein